MVASIHQRMKYAINNALQPYIHHRTALNQYLSVV